jgi:hypothetical protein
MKTEKKEKEKLKDAVLLALKMKEETISQGVQTVSGS